MSLTAAHHVTLAAFAEAHALIAVDYLQEHGATLPEVLLAYAGTAPGHVDGLPHEALWEWLHRTEPHRWLDEDCPEGGFPYWRWEAVRDRFQAALLTGLAASRRDRKRRVLALFPEVQVPCPECMAGRRPENPFDPCPRCGCQDVDAFGTVAAPGLIPREPNVHTLDLARPDYENPFPFP